MERTGIVQFLGTMTVLWKDNTSGQDQSGPAWVTVETMRKCDVVRGPGGWSCTVCACMEYAEPGFICWSRLEV